MALDEIVQIKRKEIAEQKRLLPIEKIKDLAGKNTQRKRSLAKALSGKKINLICELKKSSPSEGLIRKEFNAATIAQEFEAAGASAISVVTEKHHFEGDPGTLKEIRSLTSISLLRKDFIFEPYQIYETALLEADAFLIIATLVKDQELKEMIRLAGSLNLETLVEVHTQEELERVLVCGSKIIGINNRDLKTLEIDLSVAERLIRLIPKEIIAVIESGIETRADIVRYENLGAHNFLIGTTLMKSPNISQKIKELMGK